MNNNIGTRLQQFLDATNNSVHSLAMELGYNSGEKLRRILKEENAFPSYTIIYDIAKKFGNLSLEWLITGEGEMFKTGGAPVSEGADATIQQLQGQIEQCRKNNDYLQGYVDMQKEMIDIYKTLAEKYNAEIQKLKTKSGKEA